MGIYLDFLISLFLFPSFSFLLFCSPFSSSFFFSFIHLPSILRPLFPLFPAVFLLYSTPSPSSVLCHSLLILLLFSLIFLLPSPSSFLCSNSLLPPIPSSFLCPSSFCPPKCSFFFTFCSALVFLTLLSMNLVINKRKRSQSGATDLFSNSPHAQ